MSLVNFNWKRKPSFGERMSGALDTGMQYLGQYAGQQQMAQKLQGENEAAARMGVDLSGISDPVMRQKALESALRGKELETEYGFKEKLEGVKQKEKYQNKLDMFNQLRKGSEENELMDQPNEISYEEQFPGIGLPKEALSKKTEPVKTKANKLPHSPKDVEAMTFTDPAIAKIWQAENESFLRHQEHQEGAKRTVFQSDREYHSKVSQPIVDKAQSVISTNPIKKGLVNQQRRDIASGDTSGIIPYLIEKTGLETYRNPASARFKTISKDRFVENLHRVGGAGARPNQFIEQQLSQAQPALGRSEEANQTILDLEDFVDDMELQRAKVELGLAEEDREKYGYARNDIALRADKKMKDYANKRQDEMAYDIRQRHESNITDEDLTRQIMRGVPDDTPLTLRSARILMIKNNYDEKKAQAEARKLGFSIPLETTYMR